MTPGKPIAVATRPAEKARLTLAVLAPETPLLSVFQMACQLSAAVMQVERVGIWLLRNHDQELVCSNLYELSKECHSREHVLKVASFPQYFESLRHRKAVPAEQAAIMSATDELRDSYLLPNGITSMLDAGIFLDGRLYGVVCNEQVGSPREWRTEDRDFAGSIADLVAIRILQARLAETMTRLTACESDRSLTAVRASLIETAALQIDTVAAEFSKTFRTSIDDSIAKNSATPDTACRRVQTIARQVALTARDIKDSMSFTPGNLVDNPSP